MVNNFTQILKKAAEILCSHNKGCRNSGEYNYGSGNSGNYNYGYFNNGDYNSGDFNAGNFNIGYCNSGNYNNGCHNSGCCNYGDKNSGNYNRGRRNSGDFNKTNYSSGCFNTIEPKIFMFNKPSEWTYSDWRRSKARALMLSGGIRFIRWFESDCMTDKEKNMYPEHKITGGYSKELDYFEVCNNWWNKLSDSQKNIIKNIPNFDSNIFKEITGIDVD